MRRVPLVALRAARRPDGYLDDVLSQAASQDDTYVYLEDSVYAALRRKYAQDGHPLPDGPGTELKALLSRFGIQATPTCGCNQMANRMNVWGPDECLNHIEEIVDVMEQEAGKRGLPFLRSAGRLLVRRAVGNARRRDNGQ